MNRLQCIYYSLISVFVLIVLEVIDDSVKYVGYVGVSLEGEMYYIVVINSCVFVGLLCVVVQCVVMDVLKLEFDIGLYVLFIKVSL